MNSSLYECRVTHQRFAPRRHRFSYRLFLFALDLDELDAVSKSVLFFSRNAPNVCSFRDDDHLPGPSRELRANVERWLVSEGVTDPITSVLLVTSVRIAGYVFNPVSFYVCLGTGGEAVCAVSEVSNTYGEMKPFLVPFDRMTGRFRGRVQKNFYISPFLELDDELEFRIEVPDDTLRMDVDTWRGTERLLAASLEGKRRPLTSGSLALCLIRYPLVTLHVVSSIHWQALRLWLKRLPFHAKGERPGDQRGFVKGGRRTA